MRFYGSLLLLAIVFYLGGVATAEASCEQSLEFSRDGSISEWVICQNDKPITVIDEGDDFFRLNLVIGHAVEEIALNWALLPSKADEVAFIGTDDQHQIEVMRTYRQSSNSELSHTVRITGSSKTSTPQVSLRFTYGRIETSNSAPRTTFADLVYGFRRAYMSQDGRRWSIVGVGAQSDRVAIYSRHSALIIESSAGLEFQSGGMVQMPDPVGTASELFYRQGIVALTTQTPVLEAAGYGDLMFVDLWGPLAVLSKWIEAFLITTSRLTGGIGLAIVVLALAIRLLTYPVTLWATRKQHEYSVVADKINPLISDIRAKYKGAEQSERILAIYSENNISPFSGLKGSIGLLVQIPFLLAVFNVTISSSIFVGESFLWISDLSQADRAFLLPFSIPFLGNSINMLPLLLGAVNISFADTTSGSTALAKWTPIVISLVIVLVFYSFCAAVVLYWLTVNLLQVFERSMQTRFEWLSKKSGSIAT
jgi:YidC/Oxa1 family membrane protein insertase